MPGASAVDSAITLLRNPVSVSRLRSRPLPPDVGVLLRVLAGDAEDGDAVPLGDERKAEIREAAEFYVLQVLFDAAAKPHRILGTNPGASRAELRGNLACLLRWLRPDITGNDNRVRAERVIKAWKELSDPPREGAEAPPAERRPSGQTRNRVVRPMAGSRRPPPPPIVAKPLQPKKWRRRFALGVLAGLGLAAALAPADLLVPVAQFAVDVGQYATALVTGTADGERAGPGAKD